MQFISFNTKEYEQYGPYKSSPEKYLLIQACIFPSSELRENVSSASIYCDRFGFLCLCALFSIQNKNYLISAANSAVEKSSASQM